MRKNRISLILASAFIFASIGCFRVNADAIPSLSYQAHVQNIGWMPWVSDGAEAGTDGRSLRVEAIEIQIVKTVTPAPDQGEGTNFPTSDYYTPLPNPNYYEIRSYDQLPNVINTDKGAEYIVKDGKGHYITPNDVNSKSNAWYPDLPVKSNSPQLINGDLSNALNVNMHNGYYVKYDSFSGYESFYDNNCDQNMTLPVINGKITSPPLYTAINGENFNTLQAFSERVVCDSNDITKLTNAAKTLKTQFMDPSQYYAPITYDNYNVMYDPNTQKNIIIRFVVYSQKAN